ncbi:hypothetical protein [Acinetobacter stercoris]|uniref:Uncharacterized protein n=1 Tax=Acinetobacter stercoris TaxID=2126983 RepID=A0A2U3MW00_9GAMM|nr:hypothetical protein [Acinetobacter stercoris]SPL69479.1 hypothetical protein KPC_0657 [Acinetobacter stercoris]
MSHRVFLTSSPFSHMPVGRQNQWKFFSQNSRYELEANGFLPILWILMFTQQHMQWAAFVDDFDIDETSTQLARQECMDNFGDSVYPYLVISTSEAQARLVQRKDAFLKIIGNDYAEIFQEFQDIIQQHFPDYILLRTQGLPDINQAENWLQNSIIPIETLENGTSLEKNPLFWKRFLNDLQQYPHEAQYFLRGYSASKARQLPQNPELDHIREKPTHIILETPQHHIYIFIILFILLAFVAAIGTFIYSGSWMYSLIAFMVIAGLLIYIFTRLRENNNEMH